MKTSPDQHRSEPLSKDLAARIWSRLATGQSLTDLGLPTIDGRVDLRGLPAPRVSSSERGRGIEELHDLTEVRGARWCALNFSGADLESLRFFDARIDNCVFDGARCRDWRMWGTTLADTSLRSADLRDSALGGMADDGKRNAFVRVDFSKADLRGTALPSADFTGCVFSHTKLAKVDFQGCVFVDCVFEGLLDEVIFARRAFRGEHLPANEMRGVDFRRARLRWVLFRSLDMADVRWPEGDEHIVLDDYVPTLDRVLLASKSRSDESGRRIAGLVESLRKWAGPNQRTGVIGKLELMEIGGEAAVADFMRMCGRTP